MTFLTFPSSYVMSQLKYVRKVKISGEIFKILKNLYKIYWFIFEHFATFYYLYFRRYIEETFNFLMTMVLFMDSFAILVGIISNIPRILKYHTSHHLYFLWPFINIFSQGSTFMIVSMAFERYFASRNPLPTHLVSFQNIKPKTYRFSSYIS